MSFSEEEKLEWHRAKRAREVEAPRRRAEPIAECIICRQPFGLGEGDCLSEFPICVACDND